MIRFEGSNLLCLKITLATLSQKPVYIENINLSMKNIGIQDYESNFLRLIDKITSGSIIEFSETGTLLFYKPGFIVCGNDMTHECGTKRGISYFLEPLVLMSILAKNTLTINLKGVTSHSLDPSVDVFRSVTLLILCRQLSLDHGLELKILGRGVLPKGGGNVLLTVPNLTDLQVIQLVDEGLVTRIRGVAYSMMVSSDNLIRMIDGVRSIFKDCFSDLFIFSDHISGKLAGNSPGFGVTLLAETTRGCYLSAEGFVKISEIRQLIPENIGRETAKALLWEISKGGVVDSIHQSLILTMCALGLDELQQVRLGILTDYAIDTLRLINQVLGVKFFMKLEENSILLSCVGAHVWNVARCVE